MEATSWSIPRPGTLVQHRPVAYQQHGGTRRVVPASYVVSGRDEVRLRFGRYEHDRPLVIDPVITYSTYLGGQDGEAIAVDAQGSAYVTGYTYSPLDGARNVYLTEYTFSPDFPTTPGAFDRTPPTSGDAFVVKLNLTTPGSKDDCRGWAWKNHAPPGGEPFQNQGACVSYVSSSRR